MKRQIYTQQLKVDYNHHGDDGDGGYHKALIKYTWMDAW